jgi:hypothetical protein
MPFRLRRILEILSICAILLAGWRWYSTAVLRRLDRELSDAWWLDSDTRALICDLACNPDVRCSGLIEALVVPDRCKVIRWRASFRGVRGDTCYLYLWEPLVPFPFESRIHSPLVCLVTDNADRFCYWQFVATDDCGFRYATIHAGSPPVVAIQCVSRWGRKTYAYTITPKALVPHGDPILHPQMWPCAFPG